MILGRDRIGCVPIATKDVGPLIILDIVLPMSPIVIISLVCNGDGQEDQQRDQGGILSGGGPARHHLK